MTDPTTPDTDTLSPEEKRAMVSDLERQLRKRYARANTRAEYGADDYPGEDDPTK